MAHLLSSFLVGAIALFSLLAAPVMAADTSDGSSADAVTTSAYDEAKAMVDEGNVAAALPKLLALTRADGSNADAWTLLGHAYRELGQIEESSAACLKALTINPDHRGALEHQGEVFIAQGRIDRAEANLARLRALCATCEEAGDLERALKVARA